MEEITPPWMDKRGKNSSIITPFSSGGPDDKISLVLVPLIASAGVTVSKVLEPLTSFGQLGRDSSPNLVDKNDLLFKIKSIPGFHTSLSQKEIINQLYKVKGVLFTPPAPITSFLKKIFIQNSSKSKQDLCDFFASLFSIDILVCGANGAVCDIKIGEGAIIKNQQEAQILVRSIRKICNQMNINTSFLLTAMNQPPGQAVGNSLEIIEVLEILKGRGPLDALKLTLELGSEMLLLAKKASSMQEAKKILKEKILKREALSKLKDIIKAQKGDPLVIENYSLLPQAEERTKIFSKKKGFIHQLKMKRMSALCLKLGMLHNKKAGSTDFGAGLLIFKKIGDPVEKGDVLAEVHFNNKSDRFWINKEFQEIFVISDRSPDFQPLIIERIRE
ncbi:MAG: hypothetical protein HQ555_06335 [Candidatus Aminicenantes bacterium]|nr:hypothetical protein [Candidatus Aminicenantes bacterium]